MVSHVRKRTSQARCIVITKKITKRSMVSNPNSLEKQEGFLDQLINRKVDHAVRVMMPYEKSDHVHS